MAWVVLGKFKSSIIISIVRLPIKYPRWLPVGVSATHNSLYLPVIWVRNFGIDLYTESFRPWELHMMYLRVFETEASSHDGMAQSREE